MAERILVVGATGMLGVPVVRRLLLEGFRVRALTRSPEQAARVLGPEVELVEGDVTVAASLERALDGVEAAHISLQAAPGAEGEVEHRGTALLASSAARLGVARLSFVSGMYVGLPEATSPAEVAKGRAEEAIRASGVPYTLFRPTYFMETLPRHLRGRRAVLLGHQPHPLRMIAAADFARQVATAFRTPAAANRTFFVQGPESRTLEEALRLYCRIVEPSSRTVRMPLLAMEVLDRLFMRRRLLRTLELMRLMQQRGEVGDAAPTDRLLGAPMTTLEKWCEARRDERR